MNQLTSGLAEWTDQFPVDPESRSSGLGIICWPDLAGVELVQEWTGLTPDWAVQTDLPQEGGLPAPPEFRKQVLQRVLASGTKHLVLVGQVLVSPPAARQAALLSRTRHAQQALQAAKAALARECQALQEFLASADLGDLPCPALDAIFYVPASGVFLRYDFETTAFVPLTPAVCC